jgi:hypothetical protein
MAFKKKSVVTVGTKDWRVTIPRPPRHATHARMDCNDPFSSTAKTATLPIQDFGCFRGVTGKFHYLRMDNRRKVLEEYDKEWVWNGYEVEGIEDLKKKMLTRI